MCESGHLTDICKCMYVNLFKQPFKLNKTIRNWQMNKFKIKKLHVTKRVSFTLPVMICDLHDVHISHLQNLHRAFESSPTFSHAVNWDRILALQVTKKAKSWQSHPLCSCPHCLSNPANISGYLGKFTIQQTQLNLTFDLNAVSPCPLHGASTAKNADLLRGAALSSGSVFKHNIMYVSNQMDIYRVLVF